MKALPTLAAICAVFATLSIIRTQPKRERTEPPVAPPTSSYTETVAAVGLVEASTENVAIGSHLAGIVEKVCVTVGQKVKAGDSLFQLDTRHLEAELRVRQAAVNGAQAQVRTAESLLSDARDQLARAQKLAKENVVSNDDLTRRRFATETAEARLEEASAAAASALAQVKATETELERSTVTAPMDAEVLQVKVRAGEYAPTGQVTQPLLILGQRQPLNLRVDIDEHEGWRIQPTAAATAHVRGNPNLKTTLRYVRTEPMVIPKRSLTGDSTERVDTRVLQVVYEIQDRQLPLYVGQQMDVFIDAQSVSLAGTR